jgi:ElaB/YqjD/DUF883 family membrane-anchored ribosome-binding protein
METRREDVTATAEEAESKIVETVETVKDTVVDLAARASEAGAQAGEYAREAGRQATAAVQGAYGASGDVLDTVEGFARENLWGSLFLAGAIGYGLACLIKSTR